MRRLLPVLVLLPAMSAQTPATDPLDKLVADSPFVPANGGPRAAPGASGPLELRGVVFEDGGYLFSLYDQTTHEATWVRLGETGYPFVGRSFNRERDTLTIEYQGRLVDLVLTPAKTVAVNQSPPPSPPPLPESAAARDQRNNGAPPAAAPAANQNSPSSSPAAEAAQAQRLQTLADEIRRRRGTGPQPIERPKN